MAILSAEGALTYAGLRERVKRCAAFWRSMGLRPGERCVVGLMDGEDWVAAFLGLAWMGGIPIAISPRTEVSMIRDLVDDSGAVALLLEDEKGSRH
ncbi:MAG: AMP-binding protein [Rhodocyclaceae bacterium]|nr:AMP-binding protein [Rhodocyclaceae bacterium]